MNILECSLCSNVLYLFHDPCLCDGTLTPCHLSTSSCSVSFCCFFLKDSRKTEGMRNERTNAESCIHRNLFFLTRQKREEAFIFSADPKVRSHSRYFGQRPEREREKERDADYERKKKQKMLFNPSSYAHIYCSVLECRIFEVNAFVTFVN